MHVDFSVPQQDLARVTLKSRVRVSTDSAETTSLEGTVTALDSLIDATTRNVMVQATLANPQATFCAPGCTSRSR